MFLEFNKFLATGSGNDTLLVTSKGPCSHNFVISHILAVATRAQKKVHLISSGQSGQFYSLVCQRAGISKDAQSKFIRTTCLLTTWQQQIATTGRPTMIDIEASNEDYVIIDDVLPMLTLTSVKDVVQLVYDLKSKTKGTFVIGLKSDDVETERLSNLLKTLSNLWVDVFPLSTGYSKDIHGVIRMQTIRPIEGNDERKMHFKVTERGARLFAIGGHVAIG